MSVFQGATRLSTTECRVPHEVCADASRRPRDGAMQPDRDLSRMTVSELRRICAERRIEVPKKATKARLLAALEG